LYGIPVGIIVARLYYVISNWNLYISQPVEVLFIWHGGLSIYGALFGIILVIYGYTRYNNLPFWHWADLAAPGLAISQAVGQWGKFINQESFGYPTDATWGVYIDFAFRPDGYEQYDFFQPTQTSRTSP
jgi:phosphatidylglycerol:prolipoprotein diacylglycerol transferase